MIAFLMISTNLANPGPLEMKVFLNKVYGVIVSVSDVTNKILLCDPNCIIDLIIWSKFRNSSISSREVIITSFS